MGMGMGWGNIYGDGVGMGKILRGWGVDGVNFFYCVILYYRCIKCSYSFYSVKQ